MKVAIEMWHPADVHNYKNMIRGFENRGHETKICVMDKDVSLSLLNALGLDYEVLGNNSSGSLLNKALLLASTEYRMLKIAARFKPDVFVSGGSPVSGHLSRITGKPHIAFFDTEHATLVKILTLFTDVICTPNCFRKDFGKKHVRYNGYKELAYLHPNYFKPDPSVLGELGLNDSDKFIIVRFVSWVASHDIGQHGFDLEGKRRLVAELEKYGRVIITSESPLPEEFEKYRFAAPPERLHDLLYYATLYVGEGATVASECAVLGTPAIYVNTLRLGYLDEQEKRYGLVYNFSDPETGQNQAIQKALELLQQPDLKNQWAIKRKKLLDEKIDVTEFMVDFIENYPESFREYKKRNNGSK